ncbi:hypothetical protein CL622_04690 [archaeon]|nr:hypothetical protein [archaeon]|tara:strand:+ start:51 stop:710 length:660 start_codon:yes stop_codon:yes gene_type:complete
MAKSFLVTRPKHDLNTFYLHSFLKETVKEIKDTDEIHLTDLEGPKATRINLEKCVIKRKPGLIFLNGHGTKKEVAGHNDETILNKQNIQLTQQKIVYALSCDSLADLGKIAIKKGTKAYIGYKAKFMIVHDPTRGGSPNKDKNAFPFKKACSTLIHSLVFGTSVKTSVKRTKGEYIELIQSYGTSEDDPYGDIPLIRFALTWDYDSLGFEGDPNAVFSE